MRVFSRTVSKRITATVLSAAMAFTLFSSMPVFAQRQQPEITEYPDFSHEDSEIKGEYVPGEAIICVREEPADEDEIREESLDTAGETECRFLMDVSNAAKAMSKEEEAGDMAGLSPFSEDEESPVVLKLVHSDSLSTEELISLYSSKPGVLFAEPNYIRKSCEELREEEESVSLEGATKTPDITSGQFAYDNGPGGMDVPDWNDPDNKNAEGVVVAVLDSGVDYTNEDLDDVMWDEGEDYPQLVALGGGKYGINTGYDHWIGDEENRTEKNDPMDEFGHGTDCAGIIAAEWNGIGVSGAANGARIMAVKHHINNEGMSNDASAVAGYEYIITAKKAGVNVVAVNCSFGGGVHGLAGALCVREAGEAGIVSCYAAGNSSLDHDIYSSGASLYSNIPQEITVNSMDKNGNPSDFSDYGRRTTDIYAPGTWILSTYPNEIKSVLPGFSKPLTDDGGKSVYDAFEGNELKDCYFDYTPDSKAEIKIEGGEMKISGTEVNEKRYRHLFTLKATLPSLPEGKQYYLSYSSRISDDGKWFLPVFMKNKNTGKEELVSRSIGSLDNNLFSDSYPIDETRFDVENLEMDFYLVNISDAGPEGTDPVADLAIGEILITDEVYPYAYLDGTSMAAPAVAGEVAILAAAFPDDTVEKRAARVLAGAIPDEKLKNLCITGGKANVSRSLDESTYTPVINSVSATSDGLKISGYFFGENPEVTIIQGSSLRNYKIADGEGHVKNEADGRGEITLSENPGGLKRDEEIIVTVMRDGKSYTRTLMPSDPDELLEPGDVYPSMSVPESELLDPAIIISATALKGGIYFLYQNDVTHAYDVIGYKEGRWFAPEEHVNTACSLTTWDGQLLYTDKNDPGILVFHDGNRVIRRTAFVPQSTAVPIPDGFEWVLTPPDMENDKADLYYDGKDVILIRSRDDKTVVYRVDPFSGSATYLGTLKNSYNGGAVIVHEEKGNGQRNFYIIGTGTDDAGDESDFVAEKFTIEPFETTLMNDAAPEGFENTPGYLKKWSGCGVKDGIYLTGAHTVSGNFIMADNYYYDYDHPEKGFQPGGHKISFDNNYYPAAVALNGRVYFLALTNAGYVFRYTEAETLPAYGDVPQCDHPKTMLTRVRAGTCTEPGYSGDYVCTRCMRIMVPGETTAKDPDNHDFDYANGTVVKEPTYLSYGETEYHCRRDPSHTIVLKDIPILPSEDGRDYSDFAEDTKDLSGNAAPKIIPVTDGNGNRIGETILVGGREISKTLTDPESGKKTVESKVWIAGLEQSYTYTGQAIKPDIHIYDGTKKLSEGTDYKLKLSKNRDVGRAVISVKFKGNYRNTKPETAEFSIAPAILGQDIIAHEICVPAKKSGSVKIKPVLTWASTGKKVSHKYFTVTPSSLTGEESISADIVPKDGAKNYSGRATLQVRAVGDKNKILSGAKVKFDSKSYACTGKEIVPKYELTLGGKTLIEGKDYRRVSLCNNTDPGTAVIIFEAVGDSYAGTRIATFKISGKKELGTGAGFTFIYPGSVPYAKGGVRPAVTIKDYNKNITLREGRDYKLSYSKNKDVTGNAKTAEIHVKGKGKYTGNVTLTFAVTQQSLKAEGISIIAADQFTTASKLKKPSVTIVDTNGKKLKEGTDYTLGTPDTSGPGNTENAGVATVTVTGKGGYENKAVTATFRYGDKLSDIGRARIVKKIGPQDHTGDEIKLSATDTTGILTAKDKTGASVSLLPGTHFSVAGYAANVNKGTARVTLRGTGDFAGTKMVTFKIMPKKVEDLGALIGGEWKDAKQ